MTEVCLSLITENMGRTRPTAPKARRRADGAAEVGAREGVKSPSCFRLSLLLHATTSVAASPNLQAVDSTILPPQTIGGRLVAPQLCDGCRTGVLLG